MPLWGLESAGSASERASRSVFVTMVAHGMRVGLSVGAAVHGRRAVVEARLGVPSHSLVSGGELTEDPAVDVRRIHVVLAGGDSPCRQTLARRRSTMQHILIASWHQCMLWISTAHISI